MIIILDQILQNLSENNTYSKRYINAYATFTVQWIVSLKTLIIYYIVSRVHDRMHFCGIYYFVCYLVRGNP